MYYAMLDYQDFLLARKSDGLCTNLGSPQQKTHQSSELENYFLQHEIGLVHKVIHAFPQIPREQVFITPVEDFEGHFVALPIVLVEVGDVSVEEHLECLWWICSSLGTASLNDLKDRIFDVLLEL